MTEDQLRSILLQVLTTGNISYIRMNGFLIGDTADRAIEIAKKQGLIPSLLEEDEEENEHICEDPERHAEGGHDI